MDYSASFLRMKSTMFFGLFYEAVSKMRQNIVSAAISNCVVLSTIFPCAEKWQNSKLMQCDLTKSDRLVTRPIRTSVRHLLKKKALREIRR